MRTMTLCLVGMLTSLGLVAQSSIFILPPTFDSRTKNQAVQENAFNPSYIHERHWALGMIVNNYYALRELNSVQTGFLFRKSTEQYSTHLCLFDANGYQEFRGGLGYARYLSQKLSAGVSINYQRYSSKEYEISSSFNADLGMSYAFNQKLSFYSTLKNLSPAKGVPTAICLTVDYGMNAIFSARASIFKEWDKAHAVVFGCTYLANSNWHVHIGYSSIGKGFIFGLSRTHHHLYRLQMEYKPRLGFSARLAFVLGPKPIR